MSGRATLASDRDILEARARTIARRPDASADDPTLEVLTFSLSQERFAVEPRFVHRIVALPVVTVVPGVSKAFLGVVNLHGNIVPVADLGFLLNIPARPRLDSTCHAIVLGHERYELALVAETLGNIHEIAFAAPAHAPESPLMQFITNDAVIVLSAEAILTDGRLTTSLLASHSNPVGESL
ncbi:MAG TPA: chemotaxis protein CheW [Candidatus Baltobacteraceae bacterium]|nr:chemotaxis protein CheW [Candidatus Baltobacteraceae bacterium]